MRKQEERYWWNNVSIRTSYLQQQVIFQDPLNWLQQEGAQREGALQSSLPVPEELGQSFTPHAVGQRRHRAGGRHAMTFVSSLKHVTSNISGERLFWSVRISLLLTWDNWCSTECRFQSIRSEGRQTGTSAGFTSWCRQMVRQFYSPYLQSTWQWPQGHSHTCPTTATVHWNTQQDKCSVNGSAKRWSAEMSVNFVAFSC